MTRYRNHIHLTRTAVLLPVLVFSCIAAAQEADVWREATLYRDEWGTPHVYAENPFAMAYVFGYAQAEDHAEHILLAYRMANGRLAAVLGEAYAESDAFSLKVGHAQLAAQALAVADPVTLALCEGFATGMNAWLVEHAASLPAWADGVQPQDILAYWHAFLMSMAPFELPGAFRRTPAMQTGNAWAMNAERSTEGKPTLVINPHQNHDGFFQWYEAHLVVDDMNIYGTTLRGLPVILQGHNDSLGWALTPNWPDFADMFTEDQNESQQRNPNDPRISPNDDMQEQVALLQYMSNSLPYNVNTGTGLETRYVPAFIGPRGPLFEDAAHGLNSWYVGGFTDFGGLLQLVEMARAPNIEVFWAALAMHQMPCFHVIYADRYNNIFYLYNTKAGLRLWPPNDNASPDDPALNQAWDVPVSVGLSAVAWHDVFAPDELPNILNPPSGYVQACGNTPWTVTEPMPLDPSFWPPWLFFDQETYRAARVRQLLRSGQRSFRDHQSILFDVVVPAALDMVPALLRAVETRKDLVSNAHPDFWAGIELLRSWNYIAEINSPGMTFYHLWWRFAHARAGQQQFPTEAAFYEAAHTDAPVAQDIMLRAVEEAARELRNEYSSLNVPWGEVHRIRRGTHEAPLPGAQSGDPVFTAGDYTVERGRLVAGYGYGFAMVTQFGERPESVSLLPFGTSLDPESPHFDDQIDLMLERRFKRVRFDNDAILRNTDRAVGKCITLMPLGVSGAVTFHAQQVINARLNTETEAPAPLPRDVIPFSLYMHPERVPASTLFQIELSIHIPPELCDDAAFHSLMLYRHEPGLSWHPVALQKVDAATRIIYAQDDVPARWYAVLGPADAAGAQRYSDNAAIVDAYQQDNAPVGLDALLSQQDPQPAITNTERRVFRLERHDTDTASAPETTTESPVTGEDTGKTFRFERLDKDSDDSVASEQQGLLQQIPGMHFGPAARERDESTPGEDGRVFRMERLDTPAEGTTPPEIREGTPEGTAASTPPALTLPDLTETPEPVAPAPPVESGEDAPTAESPTPVPEQPAPDTFKDDLERQRKRPPLPDIIPQDPAFVFGPAGSGQDVSQQQGAPGRVFNIERLDAQTTAP